MVAQPWAVAKRVLNYYMSDTLHHTSLLALEHSMRDRGEHFRVCLQSHQASIRKFRPAKTS